MYTVTNFKTKKALKEAVESGEQVAVFQPGPFGGNTPRDGKVSLEGPHFPKPHTWYATGTLQDGFLISIDK